MTHLIDDDVDINNAMSLIEYWYWIRWESPKAPKMDCPFCDSSRIGPLEVHGPQKGRKSYRVSCVWKCKDCERQFSDTSQTVFSRSKIRIEKWIKAIYICERKEITILELACLLHVSYKTAWNMRQKAREIIKTGKINLDIPIK
jgi:transposase-like protein